MNSEQAIFMKLKINELKIRPKNVS
jgi:hypothetical protein